MDVGDEATGGVFMVERVVVGGLFAARYTQKAMRRPRTTTMGTTIYTTSIMSKASLEVEEDDDEEEEASYSFTASE